MTVPVAAATLLAADTARVHVTAVVDDASLRLLFRGSATVVALDGPNGVLIAKTDDDREVRIPVDLEPVGGRL